MIKLTRPPEPQVLCNNRATWTRDIIALVDKYGEYKKIPLLEKEAALKFYRHDDIRNSLKESSFQKCAFCEGIPAETGFAEVEHFHPKSLYTDKAFEWTNLLYSCKACNNKKLNHDTLRQPIINPYDLDPRDCFTYTDIMIQPKAGANHDIAEETIEVCGLSDKRLFSARGAILVGFRIFEADIREALGEFNLARTSPNKQKRAGKINDALRTIEELAQPSAKLSNFCAYLLANSQVYQEAKQRLLEYTSDSM
ncbi:TIGR02646 family protein [Yersinia ruckeri]|uniref:retron system putative HNH endonuclease n=1 Tax=Yersinia ruckeri TaxID=29486 RepID=UPI0022379FD5|nr:retron system putative HNH endonuclease [Yersinia ruckeri]EKN4697610.1 TIGR02646 family protein [Yersinia ruckeri]MCW6584626.1 TIGR02646 family protein [Yersinia ruckeri]